MSSDKTMIELGTKIPKKKFIVTGGWIESQKDRQRHYISADRVATLFGVKGKECYFVRQESDLACLRHRTDLVWLCPSWAGNYGRNNIPKNTTPIEVIARHLEFNTTTEVQNEPADSSRD